MSDKSQQTANTLESRIQAIREEIRKTPYHKGTEHHIGKLRARLARLRDKQYESHSGSKGGGGGYAVKKQGDATVVLIGPPSAGKSTLINIITNAESKVAPYEFTTVSVIPGMLKYNDAYIQILDVPGLIEGARSGKGRGKEVLSVARGADLLVIMTDVKRVSMINTILKELEDSGIRVNKQKPEIIIKKKLFGGIDIYSNIHQEIKKETIKEVAMEFGIRNADITLKENITLNELIDSFSPNRVYIPAIFVLNKIDQGLPSKNILKDHDYIKISAQKSEGIESLKKSFWDNLHLVKVYLVKQDEDPNNQNPIIMKRGDSLGDIAKKIGSDFAENKKLAKIWGDQARYQGQEVPLTTKISEGLQVRFI